MIAGLCPGAAMRCRSLSWAGSSVPGAGYAQEMGISTDTKRARDRSWACGAFLSRTALEMTISMQYAGPFIGHSRAIDSGIGWAGPEDM